MPETWREVFHALGHEDGKPAETALKDCKWQRAEAGGLSPVLLLEQLLGWTVPTWAWDLFWKEIVGSLCKTVQEHTVSYVVHVHQEKCNKNWETELFSRLEIGSGGNAMTQGHLITFLYSCSGRTRSGWWEAEPRLPLLPHWCSVQERGSAMTSKIEHLSLQSYRRNSPRRI